MSQVTNPLLPNIVAKFPYTYIKTIYGLCPHPLSFIAVKHQLSMAQKKPEPFRLSGLSFSFKYNLSYLLS